MSANVSLWKNVQIAIQSVIGTALTVSAVSKANPGVATSTAHGLSNGDFVLLSVQGMHQIDGMVVRVASIAANTFELEGVDTTLFDTFTSGSAYKLTLGTSIGTALDVNAAGGDFNMVDVTTIHDSVKKQIPGLPNAATFTFNNIWDVADAGLLACKAASDLQAQRAVRITFANGQKVLFNGYIGCILLPGGTAQDKVTSQVVITMFGKPMVYST